MTPQFSVLICGAGNIAHRFDTPEGEEIFTHTKGFMRHGGFRVAAIIDEQIERAREAAEIWNIPHYGKRLEDVSDHLFDVISICTPDATHNQYLRAALALEPKLVFCEKPLSASDDEASALVDLYRYADIHLAVNYSRRWLSDFQELSKQALSGAFGKLISARIKYYKGFLHNASHFVDLLQMLTEPRLQVGAISHSIADFSEDDLTISGTARMESAIADGSSFPFMFEGYDSRLMSPIELEVIFENTAIKLEELNGSYLTVAKLRENETYPGFYEFSDRTTTCVSASLAMQSAVGAIYNTLAQGTMLASTGQTALETLRLCKRMSSFPTI
ncbi:MAG: Gfo/Idh/MocA family oxidoreductase [Candidatus Kapabacteria bacterium]|jgi:predicted dehydrogenase|nr:Gfo/Idh/MocA family oxidoreductase [Candidatus Kapabacteria bacterium]